MTVQDRINEYWTGRAPAYDAYQQRPERLAEDDRAWAEVWAQALPEAPIDVLDVGTGSGHVAVTLARLGHRVTGIDLSEGMLERARAYPGPTFQLGDAVAPPFAAGSFDAVVSRYVMWTLRDPEAALANWIQLVKPGGTVAAVDSTWFPNGPQSFYDGEIWATLPLAAASSINQTATVFEKAGLTGVTVTPLTRIHALDEKYGVAENHVVQMQFLITGRR
ncbi:class I SAM-dependent methyltransferase [Actinoplanes sp. NPDC051851]|uniref:class I SAM-dependent methyltransferase n=1 Tax=Actinoplanes sp. NPDC051851 TaxID=3154753 RepID=UPI003428B271